MPLPKTRSSSGGGNHVGNVKLDVDTPPCGGIIVHIGSTSLLIDPEREVTHPSVDLASIDAVLVSHPRLPPPLTQLASPASSGDAAFSGEVLSTVPTRVFVAGALAEDAVISSAPVRVPGPGRKKNTAAWDPAAASDSDPAAVARTGRGLVESSSSSSSSASSSNSSSASSSNSSSASSSSNSSSASSSKNSSASSSKNSLSSSASAVETGDISTVPRYGTYTRGEVSAAMDRVTELRYGEVHALPGGSTVSAHASGDSLGSCHWSIRAHGSHVVVLCRSRSRDACPGHARPQELAPLQGAHAVVVAPGATRPADSDGSRWRVTSSATASSSSSSEADREPSKSSAAAATAAAAAGASASSAALLTFDVDAAAQAAAQASSRGARVVIPVRAMTPAVLLDFVPQVAAHIARIGAHPRPTVHVVSPSARPALAMADVLSEWLEPELRDKTLVPEPPFPIASLQNSGALVVTDTVNPAGDAGEGIFGPVAGGNTDLGGGGGGGGGRGVGSGGDLSSSMGSGSAHSTGVAAVLAAGSPCVVFAVGPHCLSGTAASLLLAMPGPTAVAASRGLRDVVLLTEPAPASDEFRRLPALERAWAAASGATMPPRALAVEIDSRPSPAELADTVAAIGPRCAVIVADGAAVSRALFDRLGKSAEIASVGPEDPHGPHRLSGFQTASVTVSAGRGVDIRIDRDLAASLPLTTIVRAPPVSQGASSRSDTDAQQRAHLLAPRGSLPTHRDVVGVARITGVLQLNAEGGAMLMPEDADVSTAGERNAGSSSADSCRKRRRPIGGAGLFLGAPEPDLVVAALIDAGYSDARIASPPPTKNETPVRVLADSLAPNAYIEFSTPSRTRIIADSVAAREVLAAAIASSGSCVRL